MGKIKSKWICQSCGYQSASFLGRCPECNDFGTFTEEVEQELTKTVGQNSVNFNKEIQKPTLLKEVREENAKRISSGFKEFDRILGGGLTAGSLTLLAGDPGIGKSTLILQTVGNISSTGVKTLYICAEESTSQVKLRAKRLEVDSEHLYLSSENSLENIINFIEENKPEFLVIDSIQSIFTNLITSSAGTVSQIRECTNILMKLAKQKNITTIVIGHVTKDGNIAGPKVLEHMVDTVVNFEGDRYKTFRVLRAIKNRFGSTSEIGIFNMEEDGLREVLNPNEMFLTSEVQTSGSAIISALEGTRVLLLEVQALTSTSSYTNPRRVNRGIEYNRLLQIIAVLEKRVGLNLSHNDIYINIIGGLDIDEPASDLGVALAILACYRDIIIPKDTVLMGEIGLSGEVRYVDNIEKRLNEAQKMGFKKAVVPNVSEKVKEKLKKLDIEIAFVKNITEAISKALN